MISLVMKVLLVVPDSKEQTMSVSPDDPFTGIKGISHMHSLIYVERFGV